MALIVDATNVLTHSLDKNLDAVYLREAGAYKFRLDKIVKRDKLSPTGNAVAEADFTCIDTETEGTEGAKLKMYFAVTGKKPNGEENIKTLFDIAYSAGRSDLVDKNLGRAFDAELVFAALAGSTVYGQVILEDVEGRFNRALLNKVISEKQYNKLKEEGGEKFRNNLVKRTAKARPGASSVNGSSVAPTVFQPVEITDARADEV